MDKDGFILGTRGSILALWQANYIKDILESKGFSITLKVIKTKGDKILDAPLAKIGGKGLFTKELELCLLSEEIDFAVHSLKDVPIQIDSKLSLCSITKREDDKDCFISQEFESLEALPRGARVGTTSLRRAMQLKAIRSDLVTLDLRGNVQRRLEKLEQKQYDAIILANAAIKRLDLESKIKYILPFSKDKFIPAMCQGALGLECRDIKHFPSVKNIKLFNALKSLEDESSSFLCKIERYFIKLLNGGCQSPIGINASFLDSKTIKLRAIVGNLDASRILKKEIIFLKDNFKQEVESLVSCFINNGAKDILIEVSKKLG